MRKKRLVALGFAGVFAVSMSMTAMATNVGSMYAELHQEADGSYSYHEEYFKEDGTLAKNEWVHYGDAFGCKVYKYFGSNGDVLTDTTTPDGCKVNNCGEWYEHCPGAAYCTVENYFADNSYYPFSYDGAVLKNDYLGVSLNYTESDYQNGYQLEISNVQGVFLFSGWSIKTPLGGTISFGVYPTERAEYVTGRLGHEEDNLSVIDITREQKIFAGKTFAGYRQVSTRKDFQAPAGSIGMGSQMASFSQQSISSTVKTEFTLFKAGDTRTQIELYHKNPENSGSMSISIVPVSGTDEAQIEEWLNTHFTFTK